MTHWRWVVATTAGVLVLAASAVIHGPKLLVWNASASAPIGLYAVAPPNHFQVGDLVAVMAPEPLARFMSARGYLPQGAPLIKHIAALPGARVCRWGPRVSVNGRAIAPALSKDRRGRVLPRWRGCATVQDGQVFLMNPAVPDSFDGRYFGLLSERTVIGRAVPLWTDEAGDGRFQWRARPSLASPPSEP